MMENNRNAPCHCGSGLKYKKCCMNKDKSSAQTITRSSVISVVRFGLENLDALEGAKKKVRVKDITTTNDDTLQIQFHSYSANSIDIKLEIGTIMGFLSGFFRDGGFDFDFRFYAVRAYDESDKELINAISSKQTAQLIGSGNSIDWLKSTLFQENTDDYRLSIAKRIISEIETTLRHVMIDVLSNKFGEDWWNKALNSKLGSSIKETYLNQFGEEISDGNVLINYAYLLQLKKVISTHWPLFKHLFSSKTDVETSLEKLNEIRREEAHNRNITEAHLVELNRIHTLILSDIAEKYPEILPTYLIENWQLKIKKVMTDSYKPIYQEHELLNEPNPKLKLIKSVNSTLHLIEYLNGTISRLKEIVTPVQKKKLHFELIELFEKSKKLQEQKLDNVKTGEFDELLNTIKSIEKHEKKMNDFAEKFLLSEG